MPPQENKLNCRIAHNVLFLLELVGGPGRSPTCDLRVRSALLYATELPGHVNDLRVRGIEDSRMSHATASVPDSATTALDTDALILQRYAKIVRSRNASCTR